MTQGTAHKERNSKALDPSFFDMDERSLRELFLETKSFAQAVRYEENGKKTDWTGFFEEGLRYLQAIENGNRLKAGQQQCPPHLALFLAFLRLLLQVKDDFNTLTRDHMLFFYQKVLRQSPYKLRPDKVFVFLELARNQQIYQVPRGTQLSAGKGPNKKPIIYETDRDLYLNKARINQIHAIYNSKKSNDSLYVFHNLADESSQASYLPNGESETWEPGWFPFGEPNRYKNPATIGFGIRSPILELQEGSRQIFVSIPVGDSKWTHSERLMLNPNHWEVTVPSGDDVQIKPLNGLELTQGKLIFSLILEPSDVALTVKKEPNTTHTFQTYLEFTLKGAYSYARYAFWQNIKLSALEVRVVNRGKERLIVKNDYGFLQASQAFQPFGYTPVVGSNFFVHTSEIVHKNITKVTLRLKWKGIPENFKTYYEGYLGHTNSLVEGKDDFQVVIAFRQNKQWVSLTSETVPHYKLFADELSLPIPEAARFANKNQGMEDDGLIRITLIAPKKAFGHSMYASVYTKAIMAQLQQKDDPIPNPPYTPTVESLQFDYEARQELSLAPAQNQNSAWLYHIEPFGKPDVPIWKNAVSLVSQDFNSYGQMFVSIASFTPPGQLTLFFKILEENVLEIPQVWVSYLGINGWNRFSKNQLLSDTTMGLQKTGIMVLSIPAEAVATSTRMPLGFHWLRFEASAHPDRFDRILSLRTNAVQCVLKDKEVHHDHTVNDLPPDTIKAFISKKPAIKKIEQPYTSFGGRSRENETHFYTRVSERLAHKGRAIRAWDTEHLILQQFPEIYQVICKPASNAYGEPMAGSLHLLAIAKVDQGQTKRIRKPLVPAATLAAIKHFISNRISPHAAITISNPEYITVKLDISVYFDDQLDAGYYLKKLDHDLQEYLSPWAFGGEQKLEVGAVLHKSLLIKFIESRAYVDFVARVKIYRDGALIDTDRLYAGEHSILISSNAHRITVVDPDTVMCQTNQGISQMLVDINFQVE